MKINLKKLTIAITMAISTTFNEVNFGVGDVVRVHQRLTEGEKSRVQILEGMVIAIRGVEERRNVIIRRIGAAAIGMEFIFPLGSPSIEKIEVVKKGVEGARRAKLYYVREKSRKEIEKIYGRVFVKSKAKETPSKNKAKKA